MPYVSYAKQRKADKDFKITNHPHKSQAEKDEAKKRIDERERKALEREAKRAAEAGLNNLQQAL
ncbi:hypothetical protein ABIB38_004274 [Massilia sp. UYP11]|uniref:hypothetical protein n=1 Tax=Massilia sp. UYP11 TaxID=1756385 RepID=UPI003D1D8F21